MRRKKTSSSLILIPVMLSFFVMGFVDLVGVAANHMQADFALSDTMANLCPAMVFLWFLLFSIPAGILMNYIGRRKTVLLSLFITTVSLLIPLLCYEFVMMLISFSLLGIGNVLLQVSLNPLVSNVVSERHLASSLSFGQFIKGIASFLAPFIASWAALTMDEWRELYPIFLLITLVSIIGLGFTSIEELDDYSESDSLKSYGRLLGNPLIRLIWIGIICHVGIDVGIRNSAVLSDGTAYDGVNKHRLHVLEHRRRKLQSLVGKDIDRRMKLSMSTRTKYYDIPKSKNILKKEKKLRKTYIDIYNLYHNHYHQIARDIVNKNPEWVVVEGIKFRDMHTDNHHMNHAIRDSRMSLLIKYIKDKCNAKNIPVITAPRFFPSTQICSRCGSMYKPGESKIYRCPECGYEIDRDLNAAINLRDYGMSYMYHFD